MRIHPTLKASGAALGLTVLALGTHQADAVVMSMNGGIILQGVATPDNPNLDAATSISIAPASVLFAIGSFATESVGTGDPASFVTSNPLVFDPITLPGAELFSFGDGADPDGGDGNATRFSFTLLSLFEVPSTTATMLTLFGNGVFKDASGEYGDTYGVWQATFKRLPGGPAGPTQAEFGFQSSSTSIGPVPDGGTSVALLGLALLGMQGIRSLRAKKS